MLDFDLAKIYGYETKNFNRQISNNMERFDKEFRFQISKEEFNIILRCKNFTSSWGGIRYLPYAFTEQGIYMLMTVLKGDLAVKQSIALIKAFKQMKDYLIENKGLLTTDETIKLTNLVNEHSNRLDIIEEKLEVVMDSFDKYYDAIINGVTRSNFMPLPTNWGYRDSKNFWCSGYKKASPEPIPNREVDLTSVRYAADRVDDKVKFTDDALKMLVKVPRPFLKLVLTGCVNWAKENNCTLITEKEMKIINDKRSKEKGKSK